MLKPIGVIGAGGWGIALAKLLADKGEPVTLWCHGAESFRELQDDRENRAYLAGIILPSSIEITRSLEVTVADKSLILCVVPSHSAARGDDERFALRVSANDRSLLHERARGGKSKNHGRGSG